MGHRQGRAAVAASEAFGRWLHQWRHIICCFMCRLIEVLQEMGRSDWQLAAMVCKTLWNYSCKITSADACFGTSTAVSELVDSLTELLGALVTTFPVVA